MFRRGYFVQMLGKFFQHFGEEGQVKEGSVIGVNFRVNGVFFQEGFNDGCC